MDTLEQLLQTPLFSGIPRTPKLRSMISDARVRANHLITPHVSSLVVLLQGTLLREILFNGYSCYQGPYHAPDIILTSPHHPLAALAGHARAGHDDVISYTNPCRDDYRVAWLSRQSLRHLIREFPLVQHNLDALLVKYIAFFQKTAVSLLLPTAEERMHAYLTTVTQKHEISSSLPSGLSQEALAQLIGVSRETFSRYSSRGQHFTATRSGLHLYQPYSFTAQYPRALSGHITAFTELLGITSLSLPEQLQFAETYLACLMVPHAPQRLVTFLYASARYHQSTFPDIPQRQMGMLIRVSRETVSRTLLLLSEAGAIRREHTGHVLSAPYSEAIQIAGQLQKKRYAAAHGARDASWCAERAAG